MWRQLSDKHSAHYLWKRFVTHTDRTNTEQARWTAFNQEVTYRFGSSIITGVMVVVILSWFVDHYVLFADAPKLQEMALGWRIFAVSMSAVAITGLTIFPKLRNRVIEIGGLAILIAAVGIGYFLGLGGDLYTMWFYGIYLVPFATVVLGCRLSVRVILTSLTLLFAILGYFVPSPEYLDHPRLASIIQLAITVMLGAIIIGHAIYHVNRSNFFIQRDLDEERLKLKYAQEELETAYHQVEEEQRKSEQLLNNILPASIAQRLKTEQKAIADGFADVTVLFADIVGFTPFSESVPPQALVEMLNLMFSAFDELTDKYGLEKIKTIGDAYMVAGGLPEVCEDHAERVANMALEMQTFVAELEAPEGHMFKLRIGINSGPVVAGVIGRKKFIYDLWGDAVNTASRMESSGLPGQIQVSEITYNKLKHNYNLESRGPVTIKGKGEMATWILLGAKPTEPRT